MERNIEIDDDIFENIPWVTIHWKIYNFFSRKLYKSLEFPFHGKLFHFTLELITSRNINSDSYEIYIEASDETSEDILKLIIRSGFTGEPEAKRVLSYISIPNRDRRHCIWKASRKYLLNNYEKPKSLGEGPESLTFYCMIDLNSEYIEEESEEHSDLEVRDLATLSYDFGNFLFSKNVKEESDVTFKRGECYYLVHRNIISARCGMFAEAIQNDNGNCVEVSNMDSTVIKQFLHYVYAGIFQNPTEDDVLQLYTASYTYDFKALRQACTKFLTPKLSEENACRRLILANEKNDDCFKKAIISFLVQASKDFWESKTWLKFCSDYSKLACEVYNAFEHIKVLLKP